MYNAANLSCSVCNCHKPVLNILVSVNETHTNIYVYILELLNPSDEGDVSPVTVSGTSEMDNTKERACGFSLRCNSLFDGPVRSAVYNIIYLIRTDRL
jgi:hypothetical protein